ncbi:MAG: glucan biosynthesis protein, partial [Burkholderiales bacterium]
GRSANGAYRFEIESRQSVRMTVKTTLFFRQRPRIFGIPALASLYDYGVGNHMPVQALYLARHTSDGLLIQTAHAAYWAPLRNPQSLYEHVFVSPAVRKFGLWQRDRRARYYGAQKGRYQDAPNVWAHIPRHLQGHVILKEWPARADDHDNIVAAFVPLVKPQVQTAFTASYRIDWTRHDRGRAMISHVVSTLIGGNAVTGARKYVIDYAGGPLRAAGAQAIIRGKVRVRPDTFITQDTVGFNPYTGGWRQVIQVLPLAGQYVHVKAWLTFDHHLASEIWEYDVFPPHRSH